MIEPAVEMSLVAVTHSCFEAPADQIPSVVAVNYHLVVAAVDNCFVEVIFVAGNSPAAVVVAAAVAD